MATSPLYNWPEPDNTDLVKNGALAIRTLGNAIDTTMGTMVAKTVVDAKGDLIAGTAADTVNRLAVGANGETLVADSSTSTGLRYTAGTVQSNPVLNSAFQVWQRGTSIAISASARGYTADRWETTLPAGVASTISRQTTNDTTNLPNIQYCLRFQRNAGQTGTTGFPLANTFESVNSIPFAGKTVTLSFYARKGADYSPTASAFQSYIITGTGTDENPITAAFTGSNVSINQSFTLTSTWQRFTLTGTLPTNTSQISIYNVVTPTGTAGANDYFEITGVQLDIGSVALPFRTYAGTIQGELAACQRYYYRTGGDGVNGVFGSGISENTTNAYVQVQMPTTMRIAPTAVDYSTLRLTDRIGINSPITSLTFNAVDTTKIMAAMYVAASGAGLTANRPIFMTAANSTSAYIGFTAEL